MFSRFSGSLLQRIPFHIGEGALECHMPIHITFSEKIRFSKNQKKKSIAVQISTFNLNYIMSHQFICKKPLPIYEFCLLYKVNLCDTIINEPLLNRNKCCIDSYESSFIQRYHNTQSVKH